MSSSQPEQSSRSASPWILPLAAEQATLPLVGGKGANLARLARAGFPVPDGFLITTQAYEAFIAANGLTEPILNALSAQALSAPEAYEEASRQTRELFGKGSLPAELRDALLAAYAALADPHSKNQNPKLPVAVRSSATAEDLPEMSFAGQQDTFLNVVGGDSLLEAVIACWSSLWTGRAISYRERNRVPHTDVSLAVVVQRMVESEASGVLFTANPLTGLRSETVIDATVGLGEALVAGQVDPDHYEVDTRTGRITGRTLGAKAISVRSRPGGGTVTVAEGGGERERERAGVWACGGVGEGACGGRLQALPDEEIVALAALGRRVAEIYGAPQDIEWAWADSTLHLLQSRPITSLFPTPAGMPADPLKAMLSFGAFQGMLDPMTPLGRDIMSRVVAAAARLFGMALTPETQTAFLPAGERLWVNLTPLLRNTVGRQIVPVITAMIDPGSGEAVDAVWRDPRLQPTRQGISPRAARQITRFMIPLAGNVLLNVLSPARRRELIVSRGEQLLAEMAVRAGEIRGDPRTRLTKLIVLLETFLDQHLPLTFRLFVSGVASGMASYNLLRVLTVDLPGISTDRILEVTRGLPNNPTTEMDLALWQVAQAIRRDPASAEAFQGQTSAALAAAYATGTLPAAAQQALGRFMARYGSRGLAEIDLGRPRWSEDPTHVMEVVAGYLQITDAAHAEGAQSGTPDAVFARSAAVAGAAVNELVAAVRQGRGGRLKAHLARFAAGRARGLMALRESPKFFVVRLFGILRAELLEVGRELVEAGELAEPDDLCYLSVAELAVYADGRNHHGDPEKKSGGAGARCPTDDSPQRTLSGRPVQHNMSDSDERTDWAGMISQRREAYRREGLRRQIPRLLLSDGRAFYAGMTAAGGAAGVLAGSPVSPGSVSGRVRVVLDPRRAGLLPGEILVCPGTDPSWTPLFLTAAGLVMEVGGLMTHGAVVAREYGIPAVVGVDRATERLQTGQLISVNGSTGEIKMLNA